MAQLASPASAFASCVSRAQELRSQVDAQRRELSRILQSQQELSQRLRQFADGGGTTSMGEDDGGTNGSTADWGAWGRSETPVEPLPPLLRVGLRVHWLVSSAEAILAALSHGDEAAAARRFLELEAAAGNMETLSEAFPVASTARSSLEHVRASLVTACVERLRTPKLKQDKVATLLAAIHAVNQSIRSNRDDSSPPAVALLRLFFDARADAARLCAARALDRSKGSGSGHYGGKAPDLDGRSIGAGTALALDVSNVDAGKALDLDGSPIDDTPVPAHISVADALRGLCDILESSRPHLLLRTLCVVDEVAPSASAGAPIITAMARTGVAGASSVTAAPSTLAAHAAALERAAADGWKQVAVAVDTGARALLRLAGPRVEADGAHPDDVVDGRARKAVTGADGTDPDAIVDERARKAVTGASGTYPDAIMDGRVGDATVRAEASSILFSLLSSLQPGEPCPVVFRSQLEEALHASLEEAAASQPALRMIPHAVEQLLAEILLQAAGDSSGQQGRASQVEGGMRGCDSATENALDLGGVGLCYADGCIWLPRSEAVDGAATAPCEWRQLPVPVTAVIHTAAAAATAAFFVRRSLHLLTLPCEPAGDGGDAGAGGSARGRKESMDQRGRLGERGGEARLGLGVKGDAGESMNQQMAAEETVRFALPLMRSLEELIARSCACAARTVAGLHSGGQGKEGSNAPAAAPLLFSLSLLARLCGALAAQLPRWPLSMCGSSCCHAPQLVALIDGFGMLERTALAEAARLVAALIPPPLDTSDASGVAWRVVQMGNDGEDAADGYPQLTLPAEASGGIVRWLWQRQRALRALGTSSLQPYLLDMEAAASTERLVHAVRSRLSAIDAEGAAVEADATDGRLAEPAAAAEARQRRALQLYFDTVFCRAALRHRPQPATESAFPSSLAAARANIAEVASTDALAHGNGGPKDVERAISDAEDAVSGWLQSHDPIAWAICRKPIRCAASRALARVAHIVCPDGPSAAQMPPSPGVPGTSAILRLAPPCGRFGYLPVQTPPLRTPKRGTGGGGASGLQEGRGLAGSTLGSDARSGPVHGTTGSSTIVDRMREETRSALVGMGQLRDVLSGGGALGERFTGVGGAQFGSIFSGMGGAARAAQLALGVKTPRG
jgi:hypothetical protein